MKMQETNYEFYWAQIPTEKEKAITYDELKALWNTSERGVRRILSDLSVYDNGDNYVIIRSAKNKGFYKTDNLSEISEYKGECLKRGKSMFALVKKINRVLKTDNTQYSVMNNLRVIRESKDLKQSDVVKSIQVYDAAFDVPMLSKMENGLCLPTPYQLNVLSSIYNVEPAELVNCEFYGA